MAKPRKYQRKGVKLISKFDGRALLADDMGLGKTIQALLWIKKHPDCRPAVIVTPSCVKYEWQSQAAEHTNMRATVLNGRKPNLDIGITNVHKVIILNYEILQYWNDFLIQLEPDIVVMDECHMIKSMDAIRTKACKKLTMGVPHVIAIGGTPLLNRPTELFPTLNILDPQKYYSFYSFAQRYSHAKRTRWGWDFSKPARLPELHRELKANLMIRRRKRDVLPELPDKIRSVIPVDIESPREYSKVKNKFIKWLASHDTDKARKAKKAEQLVQLGYLKRIAAELKMKFIRQWIDNFLEESDSKIVLFAYHKKIIQQLTLWYPDIHVKIDGNTSAKKRKLRVDKFQKKSKYRVFIGQIRAAGVGLTLTAADTLAFVEMDWSPALHIQAEDRIHRIGQERAAFIYYLVAKNTIEERLCKILQTKQEIINQVLDGEEISEDDELNIYDELISHIS